MDDTSPGRAHEVRLGGVGQGKRERAGRAARPSLLELCDGWKIWYVPMIFLWPATMALTYGLMRLLGMPLPDPKIPIVMVPVFALAFCRGGVPEGRHRPRSGVGRMARRAAAAGSPRGHGSHGKASA
jgi:hypothetical protein